MPEPQQINIDIAVSPALHPDNCLPHAAAFVVGKDPEGKPIFGPEFSGTRGVLERMSDSAGKLAAAERGLKLAGNADQATRDRLNKAADAQWVTLRKLADDGFAAIDAATIKACTEIGDQLGIPDARSSVATGLRSSDIRSGIRALKPEEREESIRHAIESHDADTVAAVLSAPGIASGISAAQLGRLRKLAESKLAAGPTGRRDALGKLRGVLERANKATSDRFAAGRGAGDSPAARAEAALRSLEGVKS